jgi:hypothetical protein
MHVIQPFPMWLYKCADSVEDHQGLDVISGMLCCHTVYLHLLSIASE